MFQQKEKFNLTLKNMKNSCDLVNDPDIRYLLSIRLQFSNRYPWNMEPRVHWNSNLSLQLSRLSIFWKNSY